MLLGNTNLVLTAPGEDVPRVMNEMGMPGKAQALHQCLLLEDSFLKNAR